MKKLRVGVLFGGKSAEHEISLLSAKNIMAAIDPEKYEVVPIGITKQGQWLLADSASQLMVEGEGKLPKLEPPGHANHAVGLVPTDASGQLANLSEGGMSGQVDVIFPVLHGTYGEDGSIQGMLRMLNVPFVGPAVLGSAVAMDKEICKRILQSNGIPVAAFVVVRAGESTDAEAVFKKLGAPVFVKPANMGSSVGVHRASTAAELGAALEDAFQFDTKVLIEAAIKGRELECAVLGNEHPEATVPGEVVMNIDDFYSYQAKYLDENGASIVIPAEVSDEVANRLKTLAINAFKAIGCEGMARVDVFLTPDEQIIVNEINTIPGFTNISMYPKLWEASGVSYPELIDRLIQLALARHARDQSLKTSYSQ